MSMLLCPLCESPATVRPGVHPPPLVAVWDEVAPMLANLVACWRRMQANHLTRGVSIEMIEALETVAVWYEHFHQTMNP